jgi:HAD superfamily hydrolase (TIGR01484 family)
MKPIAEMPEDVRAQIRGVFLDIDDTLTTDGHLTAEAYAALEGLHEAGLIVAPITGRPAGWCDHIARMWPVDAVVGENGAFFFRYDYPQRRMHRRYFLGERERRTNRERLESVKRLILSQIPGAAVAADQAYREADLAIDYCEDVAPLADDEVLHIVKLFEQAGAIAKISSIHVNGWFGVYDKLSMTRIMMRECFSIDLDTAKDSFVFIGDSPNDVPMFAYFPHSVGVANAADFRGRLDSEPTYITRNRSGAGFGEVVDVLLSRRGLR